LISFPKDLSLRAERNDLKRKEDFQFWYGSPYVIRKKRVEKIIS